MSNLLFFTQSYFVKFRNGNWEMLFCLVKNSIDKKIIFEFNERRLK